MKITTVSRLKIGQRFKWIPDRWFGEGKLIEKSRRESDRWIFWPHCKMVRTYIYDLKYEAAVVNPPAVDYGVPGNTKVQLLSRKRRS